MKRTVSLLFVSMMACASAMAQSLGVYVTDPDSYTNVRNAPSGKVVARLHTDDMIQVDKVQNGWFHISSRYYCNSMGDDASLPAGTSLWIHSSVIGASWVSDGCVTVTLRSTPSNSGAVVLKVRAEKQAYQLKQILDLKGKWVKVRLNNGKEGWVPTNLICGNSLTTCA